MYKTSLSTSTKTLQAQVLSQISCTNVCTGCIQNFQDCILVISQYEWIILVITQIQGKPEV